MGVHLPMIQHEFQMQAREQETPKLTLMTLTAACVSARRIAEYCELADEESKSETTLDETPTVPPWNEKSRAMKTKPRRGRWVDVAMISLHQTTRPRRKLIGCEKMAAVVASRGK
jgi:hypothetical protein